MREILFRAQRLDNEDFVYGELLSNGSSGTYRIVENFALVCNPVNYKGTDLVGCAGEFIQVDPKTVGQFTGLTDKNGVNIFEGDIVKALTVSDSDWCNNPDWKKDSSEYMIGFNEGTFNFCNKMGCAQRQWKDGVNDWTSIENVESFEIEVIGNIHDKN